MTSIFKNIRVFFLFFAMFLFYAHLIIPHDHHSPDSDACEENTCPVSKNGTGDHKGFPVHCHAFNDLTSEKAANYFVLMNIQSPDFLIGSGFDSSLFTRQSFLRRFFDNYDQPANSGIFDLASLRAPPPLS